MYMYMYLQVYLHELAQLLQCIFSVFQNNVLAMSIQGAGQ